VKRHIDQRLRTARSMLEGGRFEQNSNILSR